MNRQSGLLGRVSALAALSCLLWAGVLGLNAQQMLFDFGAPESPTQPGAGGPVVHWNNVTTVGTDPVGLLFDLVDTDGAVTDLWLQMLARFNGANEAGTTTAAEYPPSASRDSLYGNTEEFGGRVDVFPEFRLSGLTGGASYDLTFYGSRLGASDNRETRYTVTGSNSATLDLNVANNIDESVSVTGITPDSLGEITILIEPGPNNDNANHFTYLGVLQVDLAGSEQTWLLDFGAAGSPTEPQEPQPETYWNNIETTVGADDAGTLADLVMTNGTTTGAALQMVSRFNGANQNGSTEATVYPASATGDSLYGNTETFGGLENVLPVFKLTGLDAMTSYDFTFYGSRDGVSDNRETRYTVTGVLSAFGDLETAKRRALQDRY